MGDFRALPQPDLDLGAHPDGRRHPRDLALRIPWALSVEATSLAVLSVSVLGDKAFSPQYLIWLAPLWAYWPFRRGWVVSGGFDNPRLPARLHRGRTDRTGLLLRDCRQGL